MRAAVASPSSTTVDVLNGGYTAGLAGQVSEALVAAGYRAGQVGNATSQSATEVLYGAGSSNAANAANIAAAFGVRATASSSVAAGQVEIVLGAGVTAVPSFAASSPASSPSSASSSASPLVRFKLGVEQRCRTRRGVGHRQRPLRHPLRVLTCQPDLAACSGKRVKDGRTVSGMPMVA